MGDHDKPPNPADGDGQVDPRHPIPPLPDPGKHEKK